MSFGISTSTRSDDVIRCCCVRFGTRPRGPTTQKKNGICTRGGHSAYRFRYLLASVSNERSAKPKTWTKMAYEMVCNQLQGALLLVTCSCTDYYEEYRFHFLLRLFFYYFFILRILMFFVQVFFLLLFSGTEVLSACR